MTAADDLHPCAADTCDRLVAGSAAHCCTPCADAWRQPRWDIDGQHSPGCDQRRTERTGRDPRPAPEKTFYNALANNDGVV